MRKFIEHRIGDTRLVRLLLRWLHAGVMEDGKLEEVEEGTPQGGIISPLLVRSGKGATSGKVPGDRPRARRC